jgi:hypothetical protein
MTLYDYTSTFASVGSGGCARLIIALARAAGIRIEELARAYNEAEDNQTVFEQFLELIEDQAMEDGDVVLSMDA